MSQTPHYSMLHMLNVHVLCTLCEASYVFHTESDNLDPPTYSNFVCHWLNTSRIITIITINVQNLYIRVTRTYILDLTLLLVYQISQSILSNYVMPLLCRFAITGFDSVYRILLIM